MENDLKTGGASQNPFMKPEHAFLDCMIEKDDGSFDFMQKFTVISKNNIKVTPPDFTGSSNYVIRKMQVQTKMNESLRNIQSKQQQSQLKNQDLEKKCTMMEQQLIKLESSMLTQYNHFETYLSQHVRRQLQAVDSKLSEVENIARINETANSKSMLDRQSQNLEKIYVSVRQEELRMAEMIERFESSDVVKSLDAVLKRVKSTSEKSNQVVNTIPPKVIKIIDHLKTDKGHVLTLLLSDGSKRNSQLRDVQRRYPRLLSHYFVKIGHTLL